LNLDIQFYVFVTMVMAIGKFFAEQQMTLWMGLLFVSGALMKRTIQLVNYQIYHSDGMHGEKTFLQNGYAKSR